jgi:hypothetical protein
MSFILLSHWHGRFGNRMHQYAYGATYSRVTGTEFLLPSDWEGTRLFKNQHHRVLENDNVRFELNQSFPGANNPDRIKNVLDNSFKNIKLINPEQSPENYLKYDYPVYFDSVCAYGNDIYYPMLKNHLLDVFEFSDEVKNTESYKYWSALQGTYDLAHLRRDDISNPDFNKNNVQGYSVISMNSYLNAFKQRGFDPEKIIWVSDDYINKWHKDRPKSERFGWSYPVGSTYKEDKIFDWLEDFLKIYFARTVFRANSSFSWWACFLSPTAKIYSPVMDRQSIYGRNDKFEEVDVQFFDGNTPHWMYNHQELRQIVIN